MNYQSNYPGGGGYGGGWGGAYPPSSGPPPPPMGGYGGGPGYGGPMQSAYDVNQYGHSAYQTGGAYYGGHGGGMPGYAVPAVQQTSQMYQQQMHQAPQEVQMPTGRYADNFNQYMNQVQQMQLQQMKEMLEQQMSGDGGGGKGKSQKGRRQQQEEEEEEDEDEGRAASPVAEKPKVDEEQIKARLKSLFVEELARRQAVSGTFELTEGTVKGVRVYAQEDPVVKFLQKDEGADLAGQPWDPECDCRYLRKAMKGAGTDEDAITFVVGTRNNAQRQELKTMFKTAYGRNLIEDLESELSGNYRETMMACFVKPAYYDAWAVKEAIYGPGTDEEALVEVFMTRTNAQLQEMKKVYGDVVSPHRKTSESKLEKDISGDCSGNFKKLLMSATTANRNEISRARLEAAVEELVIDGNPTGMFEVNYDKLCDMDKAKREAQLLFKAGEDKWGTDEDTFNRIFSTRDYYQLRATWNEYVKITQRDILNSVDRETSGDYRNTLKAIVMNIRCRPMYFAERLKKSMKGLGTDDEALIRIIISRSEIDMVQIKKCFLDLTKQTLWRWLKDDCSGDYKKILQAIVGKD